ncbi:alpha/beta hydrolase [Streptococcus gallinaceus]|uniref:alpha/beta hydrolase n=1 Tax=Streptococcus gallinaceus TaxID=165758 RepID=UPI00344BF631
MVYVLKSPLELPVLNTKAAGNLIGDKQLDSVYLAGHSLGGVVAAMDSKESNRVKGLILLASYPSEKTDLSKKKLAVLSITASRDAVLNWDNYQSSPPKKRLPSDTEFFQIEGGNHSEFGDYGLQKKDKAASISARQQKQAIVQAISQFIQNKNNKKLGCRTSPVFLFS